MPELSIIIPTLNEADNLPLLLSDLASQRGVELEVVVSDGGSRDATCSLVEEMSSSFPGGLRLVCGPAGRGRQLNSGAAEAQAEWLCFLHADSRLPQPDALTRGLDQLRLASAPDQLLAGHFRLRFDGPEALAYRYYECKARLHRAGCVHGDQGLLLQRKVWNQFGPFREDRPVMEDTELAETVRQHGHLLLLSGTILTSTRRFDSEGIYPRQMLNLLLMTCDAIGWGHFIAEAPGIYRSQDRSRPLQLHPFLQRLRQMRQQLSISERLRFWYRVGIFVRNNGWQIPLLLRVRRLFRLGLAADDLETGFLQRFDLWFEPLTNHPPGRALTGLLTWIWFQGFQWRERRRFKAESFSGGVEPPTPSSIS